jgi:CRISPR-associated protein Cas2
MRRAYIVSYDISDQARWRKVWRVLRGYGDAIQLSVFRCDLDERERIELTEALTRAIHARDDQVLFVDLGPAQTGGERIRSLGRAYEETAQIAIVF